MKKTIYSLLSLILAVLMIFPLLTACKSLGNGDGETSGITETGSNSNESGSDVDTDSESSSQTDADSESNDVTDETESDNNVADDVELEGVFGPSIINANKAANSVQSYYTEAARNNYRVTNSNVTIDFALKKVGKGNVGLQAIKSPSGGTYIEDTMDVFVRMDDGETYYSSSSNESVRPNIFRLGYYYYDVHFLGENFVSGLEVSDTKNLNLAYFTQESKDIAETKMKNGEKFITIAGKDAYICTNSKKLDYEAEEFNAIELTVKAPSGSNGEIYYLSGEDTGHSSAKSIKFMLNADGEYHTYTIILSDGVGYEGTIRNLRIDIDGATAGDVVCIKDLKLLKVDTDSPKIVLDRTFHTYSDKLHQALHFIAKEDTDGIDEIGMITHVSTDKVDKLIVKADGKTYDSIESVKDWSTAEYVGFDIKDVGVFGYILADDKNSGTIKVTLEGDKYVITQSSKPVGGAIFSPVDSTDNDFVMGQRIYTDEDHEFDAFIFEAEFERNHSIGISSSNYVSYDAIRGAFTFSIDGVGFNPPYFYQWNKHYTTDITIKTRNDARNIYIRTITDHGTLEGAALLDGDGLLLPIPLEVSKNFGSEDEEPLYYCGDKTYGETVFPLALDANEQYKLTVVNVYQNWGNYPIKQLSSIQYFAPYYHLSAGVTESSCIAPWYNDHGRNLWTLPDFRSMSAPLWCDMEGENHSNQPQHTHGGYHTFLEYTDADGKYNASENYSNVITSAGLSYAEAVMSYISDDGKIKVEYTHMEFPQIDEMRSFYEIKYEILEDVSIENFKRDFAFYSTRGYGGNYEKIGYVGADGKVAYENYEKFKGDAAYLTLGKESPYVSFFNLVGGNDENNVNTGIVIHSSDITIGGKKFDGNFAIKGEKYKYSLTLDLGETTLKKGDVMTINMVIIPWGSHLSTDDSNMQNIREDSALKPLKVDVSKGERIESVFLPKVRTDDGKSAEFTLSGGANNVAVRVYGFDKLTAPRVFEKIDGKWVEYKLSSAENPDKTNNYNYYDGYFTYYDGDGTYSYSFVTNMTEVDENGKVTHLGERTFRIVAEDDFEPWPEKPDDGSDDPLNFFASPGDLLIYSNNGAISGFGSAEISNDGTYITFTGDGKGVSETYFSIFSQTKSEDMLNTGHYIVIKYRFPTTNTAQTNFQFFVATHNGSTAGKINGNGDNVTVPTVADNKWHVAIIDLKANPIPAFVDVDGEYYASHLRIDVFNAPMGVNDSVDIAYVGMTNDLEKLYTYDAEAKDISTVVGSGTGGSGSSGATPKPEGSDTYIDASSGYHRSELTYAGNVDFINGYGDKGAKEPFASKQNSLKLGPTVIMHNASTVEGTFILCFAGWTVVDSGIEKYVWSADGGKTWHDASLYNKTGYGDPGDAIKDAANKRAEKDLSAYYTGTTFQGASGSPSGVAADLSDYKGKTVNVTFAAIPKDDPKGLCLVLQVNVVHVPNEKGEVEVESYDGVASDYIDSSSKYLCATVPYGSAIDFVNGAGPNGDDTASFANMYGCKGTPATIVHNSSTFTATDGKEIVYIGGWGLATGGFEKYVWTADGGKTWHDAYLYNREKFADSPEPIINNAIFRSGDSNIGLYAAGTNFQGKAGGVAADLSEYAGQTVDVMFAMVPVLNNETVCLVVNIKGVTVPAK